MKLTYLAPILFGSFVTLYFARVMLLEHLAGRGRSERYASACFVAVVVASGTFVLFMVAMFGGRDCPPLWGSH